MGGRASTVFLLLLLLSGCGGPMLWRETSLNQVTVGMSKDEVLRLYPNEWTDSSGRRTNVEGYQTLTAGNGADALAVAAREAPDLIVLDLMMPVVSGWDVCRTLRARGIDVPIIILTARGEGAERVRGLELGADDYLTKPFSLRELLA